MRIAGTQWAGMDCWPYVRLVSDGQVPVYLVKDKGCSHLGPTPYATGRNGAPLMFYEDLSGYPIYAASFQNIQPGTYRLQAALVRVVKHKNQWYPATIIGEMVDIPLLVQ